MSLLALLTSGGGTGVLPASRWALTGSWVVDGDRLTATQQGSTAVQDVPGLDRATLTLTATTTGTVGLTVRGDIMVEASAGMLRAYRRTGDTWTQLVEAPVSLAAGRMVVRVDVDGPHVTLWDAGRRIISVSAYAPGTAVGVVQTGPERVAVEAVTVAPLAGPRINWPVFSHRQVAADIPIVAGSWEDTDINNPNIVWDPTGGRWVMYYTGYSATKATGDDGVQMAGIAYAPTLDGPWTKAPENPVIDDLSTGAWSQNGGMERLPDGDWLIAANINKHTMLAPNMGTWFYRAPAPGGPYTRTAAQIDPYVGDPFLRWNQTSGALEHWAWVYGAGGRVGARWTSTDMGATWTGPTQIVPRPPIGGVNSGEQAILVPPGKEGIELWVTTDFYPRGLLELGRGMVMGMTPDAGATWYWHVAQTPAGSLGWDSGAAFDSTLVYDQSRKRLYLYHSGSTRPDTGVLNMSIQIGRCWADWDHTIPTIR